MYDTNKKIPMIMGYRFVVIMYDVFSIMDVDLQKENYLLPLTQSEILGTVTTWFYTVEVNEQEPVAQYKATSCFIY